MLEAHIKIDKEIAVKGWRRAMRFKALNQLAYFYGVRLIVVWLAIAISDALFLGLDFMSSHLVVIAILWLSAVTINYVKWYQAVEKETVGWEFDAFLDDLGVTTTRIEPASRREWSFYKHYREFDDYLQLEDEDGNTTFVPKTDDLSDVISLARSKVARKY